MILTKSEYLSKINILLKDNSTQQISPLDVRTSLSDLVDSVHLFMDGSEIVSSNFATPDTRTTRAGELALGKLQYAGRSSEDNSAFGYYALGANYNGDCNTALGSHSMGCNMYGAYNTAVGYTSVSNNTIGSGNLGVGAFAAQNNRTGHFNIGIGHGAGAYMASGDSYKFYLGVNPHIDSGNCVDLSVSGSPPLMYGDLQNGKLAIGIEALHNYGALQVSGDATPSHDEQFSLGNETVAWRSLNEQVWFSGTKIGIGTSSPSGDYGYITINGDVVPASSGNFKLGHPNLTWDGYFNDVVISGQLHANDVNYNNINECLYDCKTLHLATSGLCDADGDGHPHNDGVCGYLTDESLDGAGFIAHSSGNDYQRNYRFLYRFPDSDIECLEYKDAEYNNHYARSRWESNISIEVESGCHFQGNRLLGDHTLSMVTQSGCHGVLLRPYNRFGGTSGDRLYVSTERQADFSWPTAQDVNFISRSGTHTNYADGPISGIDYTVMYGTVDSGVKIAHEFSSRIKTTTAKRGFSIVYHDELDA